MRDRLSTRREKYHRLLVDEDRQPNELLIGVVNERERYSAVFRLACLRILIRRGFGLPSPCGWTYLQRKRAVRQAIRVHVQARSGRARRAVITGGIDAAPAPEPGHEPDWKLFVLAILRHSRDEGELPPM